ncbi:FAD-dependent oxidoreductase [Paenochrobactrum sp. BZR 588]|uniref:FAD-dependent oxidoreductase n=1 Tax=unclassified Paenochrobactrum TaxID=2639760 RepID=UPI003852D3D3
MSIISLDSATDFLPLYDLVIIGAGPAGMSAAIEAGHSGARILVLDENNAVGGQIYRSITKISEKTHHFLGKDYWSGREIAHEFAKSSVHYAAGATVWSLEPYGNDDVRSTAMIGVSFKAQAQMFNAKKVILATGAIERPMPITGWTLPGVMTIGAGQIALKSAGIAPKGRVVLAGSGPLLYLFAAQLLDAGVKITAILDTTPRSNLKTALPYIGGFLASPYFAKGLSLLLKVRRNIRVVNHVAALRIEGKDKAERIRFTHHKTQETLDIDYVLLHHGVIPNINLTSAAGCDLEWNEDQRSFQPMLDAFQRTTKPGLLMAGDGAGIGGAQASSVAGRLAAITILEDLELISPEQAKAKRSLLQKQRQKYLRGRKFLDLFYKPAQAFRVPADNDTIVCRCEEVSAGKLRDLIAFDIAGPNQLKTFVRCGMGPCQGRLCGQTVSEMIADARDISPAEVGTYRLRAPVKPVSLREIAALPQRSAAVVAVTGHEPDEQHHPTPLPQ